jgi:DNA-binding response OmpR family regulator
VDGVEAVRRIRAGGAGGRAKDIPVIALTAYAMSGDRERFLEAGMTGYLAKPVSLAALAEAVAAHVPAAVPAGLASQVAPVFKPLLGETIAYMRERAGAAASLAEAGDLEGAARAAHDVKGTFMAMGLASVREQAELLDRACRTGDGAGAARHARDVLGLLDALEREHANGRI